MNFPPLSKRMSHPPLKILPEQISLLPILRFHLGFGKRPNRQE